MAEESVVDLAARLRSGAAVAGGARPRRRTAPRSGRRRGRGSRPRASARACWRCRTRTASGRAARSSPLTSTSTAPRRRRAPGSRGRRRRGRSTRCASGASTPRSCASAHGRAARREQPLGVRRPAVLGRRGRLLHQRLDGRERCVARRRRHRHRRLVRRAPAARRRLELRVGRGLDAVVVPLDAQLAQGAARLRRRDRGHGRDARRAALRRGVPAGARLCSAACRRASRWGRGSTASPTRSAGSTACSTRPSTSARPSLLDGTRRTRGWPTRSS